MEEDRARADYDSSQWLAMNQPEGQQRIRATLNNYLRCYLDTAPRGGELARAGEVFLKMRRYFERVRRAALDNMGAPTGLKADLVLGYLDGMERFLRTDADAESVHDEILAQHPGAIVTPEDIDAFSPEEKERWDEFKDKLLNDLGDGAVDGGGWRKRHSLPIKPPLCELSR